MGIGDRIHSHKSKLKKKTNDDNLRRLRIQEPLKAIGQCHHTLVSSRNVVRRHPRKVVYIMTNIKTVSMHPQKKK